MKCAYHSEADAVGVCVNCGRMVCQDCSLILANKVYCQSCADEIFAEKSSLPNKVGGRSGILTAGGVLGIIGGVTGLFYAILIVPLYTAVEGPDTFGISEEGVVILVAYAVLAIMQIIGAVMALKRKKFGLAMVGAICGMSPGSGTIFGVLAIIFVAMSKSEFGEQGR